MYTSEFIFANIFSIVAALKCWDCSSNTDPNCGDPFNKSTLLITDCNRIANTDDQRCIKIEQQGMKTKIL